MEKSRLKKITFEIPALYLLEQFEVNRQKEIKDLKKQIEKLKQNKNER